MTSLSDTQRILLSHGAQSDTGSLLPLPTTIRPGGGVAKAMDALLKRGLAEERETSDANIVRRVAGDIQYGVFINPAGAEAVGIEPAVDHAGGVANAVPTSAAATAKAPSKATLVLSMIGRPEGATGAELIAATGWLPHTTRAALTGLRKKGHDIARTKRDGVACYRIADQA